MAQPEWRGVLNQILYVANRYPFTDESVDRIAVDMIGRFQLWCGPDVYHQAISEALQSGTVLGPPTLRTEHDDTALRDFFRRLRDRLDSGRPWPDARFVRLSTDDWPAFADAPKIATIKLSSVRVHERTWEIFDSVPVRGTNAPVVLLRLRTGEAVALIGSYDPDVRRRRTVAMHLLDGDPVAAIASFRELCELTEDQITPLPRGAG
jgi:hypothetical protein